MVPHEAIKNPLLERRLFQHRALLAGAAMVLLVSVSLIRLAYLQIVHHEHYATLSTDNRVRLVALPPPRGLIYDRNGVLLAENLPAYRLEITPSEVGDLEQTLHGLSQIIRLDEGDLRRFRTEVGRKQPFQGIPLRFNLSEEEVARFAVNRYRFPGVEINARLGRHYPLSSRGVHAMGYVGRINVEDLKQLNSNNYTGTSHIGKVGIERYYEDLLHGEVGYQEVEINAQGRVLRVLAEQPPVPGKDIVLSLDASLQQVAEESLGSENGAVVALDPNSGEILALVSTPTYDPNLFVNGISSRDYQRLRNDPDRPLFNRALTGQYPPGSTIKPFVALAGLDYGVTWAERTIWAGGYYSLPNGRRRFRDWKRGGHGEVDMSKAITQSCDVYFYDLAYRLGIDRMHDFLAKFGFGARAGVDGSGERSGLLPSRDWKRQAHGQPWFPGETVIVGIGQGYLLATPVQLARATGMLASRGRVAQPHFLHASRDPRTGAFTPRAEELGPQIVLQDAHYWDQVIEAMIAVTRKRNGTAFRIGRDAPYTIAGKTGTAQVFSLKKDQRYDAETLDKKLHDHALFIAFAPAEAPEIAVAVVVENGGHGGSAAAPVARRVMDYYLLGKS